MSQSETQNPGEEEEEEDPVEVMMKKTGCLEKHHAVQVCELLRYHLKSEISVYFLLSLTELSQMSTTASVPVKNIFRHPFFLDFRTAWQSMVIGESAKKKSRNSDNA